MAGFLSFGEEKDDGLSHNYTVSKAIQQNQIEQIVFFMHHFQFYKIILNEFILNVKGKLVAFNCSWQTRSKEARFMLWGMVGIVRVTMQMDPALAFANYDKGIATQSCH